MIHGVRSTLGPKTKVKLIFPFHLNAKNAFTTNGIPSVSTGIHNTTILPHDVTMRPMTSDVSASAWWEAVGSRSVKTTPCLRHLARRATMREAANPRNINKRSKLIIYSAEPVYNKHF